MFQSSINFVFRMNYKAKKSYGQHFLIQQKVIDRITELIIHSGLEKVLEIGPGKGALTAALLKHFSDFIAVEADQDMLEYLINVYPENRNQFIGKDFLKLNLENIFEGSSFLICGNFPYNISSQIVFKTLEHADRIPQLIGMFQKEMAQRIVASPGRKEYGVISACTALFYKGQIEFDIGPGNFSPPPKVDSSILRLSRNSNNLTYSEYSRARKVIKHSFLHRRKTLRNNLKTLISDPSILSDSFYNQRAEDITPLEYLRLSKELNF